MHLIEIRTKYTAFTRFNTFCYITDKHIVTWKLTKLTKTVNKTSYTESNMYIVVVACQSQAVGV